jgi:hypothetical protein
MNGYRTAKDKLRILTVAAAACLLASLLFILQAAGQGEEFNWDQKFSYPAYVYHVTKTHTYSGSFDRDMYLCNRNTPDAKGQVHDSEGHYEVTMVAGPLHTPREICKTYSRLDPAKGRPPGKWAGVTFNCGALTAGKPAAAEKPVAESSLGERVKSAAENAAKGAGPGVVVVALVNGIRVLPPLLVLPAKNGRRRRKKKYTLDVRTEGHRTRLVTNGEDRLWIYGQVRCSESEINTESLTRGLSFNTQGLDAEWLVLGEPRLSRGFKAVQVRARPPTEEATLKSFKALVVVSTTIEGTRIEAPVELVLEPELVMEFF